MPHTPTPDPARDPAELPDWALPGYDNRRRKVKANNPRYAHVPQLWANPDETITIVRCPDHLVDDLTAAALQHAGPEAAFGDHLFAEARYSGTRELNYAVRNRLGTWTFVAAERIVGIGAMQRALYTQRYMLPATLDEATTMADLRAELTAEVRYLDDLAADGWDLITGRRGLRYLFDTRHPADA